MLQYKRGDVWTDIAVPRLLREVIRSAMLDALWHSDGNAAAAARRLRIRPSAMRYKMATYGIRQAHDATTSTSDCSASLASIVRGALLHTLGFTDGNATKAAGFLGISPRNMRYKMLKYHIPRLHPKRAHAGGAQVGHMYHPRKMAR